MADQEVEDALAHSFLAHLPPEVRDGLRAEGRLGHLPRGLMLYGTVAARLADWNAAIPAADEGRRLSVEFDPRPEERSIARGSSAHRAFLVSGSAGAGTPHHGFAGQTCSVIWKPFTSRATGTCTAFACPCNGSTARTIPRTKRSTIFAASADKSAAAL